MTALAGTPGTAPGGFDLGRVLGRGGSGTVHEARQASTGRVVALKVLEVDATEIAVRRRFDRERAVMAELAGHPHVVSIVDAGVHAGRPWIAMELCGRGSLARTGEPMPVAQALTVLQAIASALEAAHSRGVVHCDVKPANILVDDYGRPVLTDFGIARVTAAGTHGSTMGGYTLDHVPPEVIDGHRPAGRSDVFSLGTTVWQLLAGRPPFRRPEDGSAAATMRRIQEQPLPALERGDVPVPLSGLLAAMTAKDPAARPVVAEVLRRCEQVARAAGLPLGAPLDTATGAFAAPSPAWPTHHPSRPGAGWAPPPPPPPPPSGTVGRTDHRPDLADLTRAGGNARVAAAPPVVPAGVEPVRRDRAVVTAVALAAIVALVCGGFLAWRLIPDEAAVAGGPAGGPVVPAAAAPEASSGSPAFAGSTGALPGAAGGGAGILSGGGGTVGGTAPPAGAAPSPATPAAGAPARAAPVGGGGGGGTAVRTSVDVDAAALAAVRRTGGIAQSTVTGVACASPTATADGVVLGCRVESSRTGVAPDWVAVRVVSVARNQVDTYVMVRGSKCPGMPAWASKIDGDLGDGPCDD